MVFRKLKYLSIFIILLPARKMGIALAKFANFTEKIFEVDLI